MARRGSLSLCAVLVLVLALCAPPSSGRLLGGDVVAAMPLAHHAHFRQLQQQQQQKPIPKWLRIKRLIFSPKSELIG